MDDEPKKIEGLKPRYGTISAKDQETLAAWSEKTPAPDGFMESIQKDMMNAMSAKMPKITAEYMLKNDLTWGELWGDEEQSNNIMWVRSLIVALGELDHEDENEVYFFAVWLSSIKV